MEENKNQQNQSSENIKVLRTYTSDMAQVIRDNEISAIKIAMAEKEKRDQGLLYRESEGINKTKLLLIIGGIILIITAVIVSWIVMQKKNSTKTITPTVINNSETFILYNSSSDIDVTNISNVAELSSLIEKEDLNTKGTKALILKIKLADTSERLTSSQFLSLIDSEAPGALVRSLSNDYLLGKYFNPEWSSKNSTFLIFKTNDYNQAYASMLTWEKVMLKDLFVLFNIEIKDKNVFERQWKDIIINNKDARVLYDKDGEEILSYVFVDSNNFIITNNTNTLKEILQKIITK